jgi:hypothetical protein
MLLYNGDVMFPGNAKKATFKGIFQKENPSGAGVWVYAEDQHILLN